MAKNDFSKIPNGMPGVETRPKIGTRKVWRRAESRKKWLLCFLKILLNNSRCIHKGVWCEGSDADLVVWDPRTTGVIAARTQLQNVDYTPYEGFETQGQARMVYLRGQKLLKLGKSSWQIKENLFFVKQQK